MARARNIKPGFFRNADLVELPMEARLLFIGLWTLADREGRLEDRPKQIKMDVFPADSVDCDALLDKLSETGMVVRYAVDGGRYLQVVNFAKHQNPHRDEKPSTLPDQHGHVAAAEPALNKHRANTVQAPCKEDATTVAIGLTPDPLIPESQSLTPDPGFLKPDCTTKTIFGAPPLEATPAKPKAAKAPKPEKQPSPTAETWAAYAEAYAFRYAAEPVRNATVNGQLAQLVGRLGAQEAPQVAAFFLSHRNQFYVQAGHSVSLLLRDCEKLRTEWATKRQVTQTQAAQGDRTQTNANAFAGMLAEANQEAKRGLYHAEH
jgi:hypothetical protein